MTKQTHLGQVLRALRRRNHWTLKDVGKKTGLSLSTLSRAERDQLSLTYGKLVQLSQGLGVDIATLFGGDTDDASSGATISQRSVNRIDDGHVMDTSTYHQVFLSADLLKKKFVPLISEPLARSLEEFGPLVRHAGDEFCLVLEGAIEVHNEHYAPAVLKAGESIYFNSGMGHAYVAHGKGRCRFLTICSAPETAIRQAIDQHVGTHSSRSHERPAPRAQNVRKPRRQVSTRRS